MHEKIVNIDPHHNHLLQQIGVRVVYEYSDDVLIGTVIKQRDWFSPLIFRIVMDKIIKSSKQLGDHHKCQMLYRCVLLPESHDVQEGGL